MIKLIAPATLVLALLAGCVTAPKTDTNTGTNTGTTTAKGALGANLVDRAIYFGNPERSQGRISPDGKNVSWLAPRDGVMNIWVTPADDLSKGKFITNDSYRGISSHSWAPNSQFVYFVQDEGGNENFHVFAANVSTGEVRDLTPVGEGVRAVIQSVSNDRPNSILVGLNERNAQLFDLYLVDVTDGSRELVRENPGYAGWIVDNTLTPRFGLLQVPGGGANVVDFEGKVLFSIPAEDFLTTNAFGFDRSNEYIYAADSRGRDKAAFVKIDAQSGKSELIASSDNADIGNVLLHPTTHEPLAYAVDYLRKDWFALDESLGEDLAFFKKQLNGDLSIVSTTSDLSKALVYADAAEAPGVYYIYERANQSLRELFTTRPDLAKAQLQPMQSLELRSRDDYTLVSYLTLPPGSDQDRNGIPEKPVPMVLNVHGGPWARDIYGYSAWHQWLANRGYAVLSVNYRGSTGFGKEFVNAAVREFAGKMHNDLIDAVNWAIKSGVTESDKVAIAGGSYGGYATLIGVSFTPETFACGVDIVGPSSLATLIESFPEYWKPFLEGTWFKYVGDPADSADREDMLSRSAISRVDSIKVPLLIGQGENDPRVTKLESDQLVDVMGKKGLPVTYVNFPDEGHGFARPENRLAFYSVMEGFLAECLGGRLEPVGKAFDGSTIQVLHGAQYIDGLQQAIDQYQSE